jgi:hypothetical protein
MKNLHAVALGKLGGMARAQKSTPEQRQAWARLGGLMRARKHPKTLLSRWARLGGRRKAMIGGQE